MDSFFILQILQNFFALVEKKTQTKLICYKSQASENLNNLPKNKMSLEIKTNLVPITIKGQTWYECYDKIIYLKRAESYTKY